MSAKTGGMEAGEVALQPPSLPKRKRGKVIDMNTEPHVREGREAEIRAILGRRDDAQIEEGVQAFKEQLSDLLARGYYLYLVAYRGRDRAAIATTRRKLNAKLKRKGYTNRGELFITAVSPLDTDE